MHIFEQTNVTSMDSSGAAVEFGTGNGTITAARAVLATNVFPSLIVRNRLQHRAGLRLRAGHRAADRRTARPHRLGEPIRESATAPTSFTTTGSAPTTASCGAATTPSTTSVARSDRPTKTAPRAIAGSRQHFFITFPQLDDVRFSHRWAGAIDTNTRFCAHWGLAHGGRVAYVNGFTGLGVGAARFAADVCLDLLDGRPTRAYRTGDGSQAAAAVST